MNHASLNVANALGAWLGGVVIAAGYGYRATGVVGASLAVAGLRRPAGGRRAGPAAAPPSQSGPDPPA